MSNKRPLNGKNAIEVDKHLLTHLTEHISKEEGGVYITESVKNGTKFPIIDAIVVAEQFKKKYPFRYKKHKSDALVAMLKRGHDILSKNSVACGGPGEVDMDVVLQNLKTGVVTTPTAIPTTPVVENVTKKQKDFFASTAHDNTVVSMKKGVKSVFDGEDEESVEEEDANMTDTPKEPVDMNLSLRKLYNPESGVNKDASAKEHPSKAGSKLRKLPNEALPEYLQRKLAYKEMRLQGMNIDDAEKAAKAMSISGKKDANGSNGTATGAVVSSVPSVTFADVGGINHVQQDIRELIEYPLTHPEIYDHLGVQPPRGILLHGPPGCGKTLLANAIAGELNVPLLKISAPEIVSGVSGSSEAKLRQLFQDAQTQAPCILFIDELDAIAPKRDDSQREMEKRIVSQLLACMDALSSANTVNKTKGSEMEIVEDDKKSQEMSNSEYAMSINDAGVVSVDMVNTKKSNAVIVIGATNRVESIDMALRRTGRFDREIALGIPDDEARAHILQVACKDLTLHKDIDYKVLTKKTVGYVGADLQALTREAAVIAVNRIFDELLTKSVGEEVKEEEEEELVGLNGEKNMNQCGPTKSEMKAQKMVAREQQYQHMKDTMKNPLKEEELADQSIQQDDFEKAIQLVQPTAKREGFATLPDVSWDDVGALTELQTELDMAIVQPILDAKLFESIGLAVPAGVLLFGPPGCGKTLVAKAVARESNASFLSVKGPELLNQYVGQSEAAVRQVFKRARQCAPCVIFFDELDALVPKRGNSNGNQASERVVNQMLTELDGMDDRRNVFVIAATNRPDIIDPAMLRPGRLDKLLYISLPDALGRLSILKKHVRRSPIAQDVDLEAIAYDKRGEGYSGADISALVREATVMSLREIQEEKKKLRLVGEEGSAERTAALKKADSLRVVVCQRHFQNAFYKVRASVSEETRIKYDKLNQKIGLNRSAIEPMAVVQEGSSNDMMSKDMD